MPDPFTLVYDALWDLAEGSSVLTNYVRVGNRIKLDSERQSAGFKLEVSEKDLPELILLVSSSTANIRATSSSTECRRTYQWAISTGDIRPSKLLFPVEFALFAEMANWPAVVNALEWNGQRFALMSNIVSAEHGESDPEKNRGIKGWSAIWTAEVVMHFRTSDLLAYGLGTGTGTGTGS